MNDQHTCPNCRQPLAADAPQGLCAACLLEQGMQSEDRANAITQAAPDSVPEGEAEGAWLEAPAPEALAERFPQLEIQSFLGQGGMGAVYKAQHRNLQRTVALKVLPPRFAEDATFAERFAREARALAKLSHPNIVMVYDFGNADGLFYLMMEYVDGVNLRQAMRDGGLSPEQALSVVPQICEALQFAHDEGVVHRDIKPENVLLDLRGRVKIADFGLAKMLGTAEAAAPLTVSQQVMGTMHYMAPEQLETPLAVDHRADIYSLGVVFYELLTGELPLGQFEPPSRKAQIDAGLDAVVLRALAREPDRRYQRAGEVKTDLESLAGNTAAQRGNGQPLAAVQTTDADRDAAMRQVRGPGIALMIVGLLNLAPLVLIVLMALVWLLAGSRDVVVPAEAGVILPPLLLAQVPESPNYATLSMVSFVLPMLIALPVAGILILGGWKMQRLELYPLAVFASIVAMLPCHPGFLLGLPIGVWAIAVLMTAEVRRGFGIAAPSSTTPSSTTPSSRAADTGGSAESSPVGQPPQTPGKPPGSAEIERARSSVQAPGTALIVAGVLHLVAPLLLLIVFAMVALTAVTLVHGVPDQGQAFPIATGNLATGNLATGNLATGNLATGNLATGNLATGNLATGPAAVAVPSFGVPGPLELMILLPLRLVFGVVMILGGLRMKRLEAYTLALVAAVVGLVPCGPMVIITLPIGIWALIVLNRESIRAAFAANAA